MTNRFMTGILAATFAALSVCTVLAQETPESIAKRKARIAYRERRLKEMGGYVSLPSTGKVIRVVNAQARVGEAALLKTAKSIQISVGFPVEVTPAEKGDLFGEKYAVAVVMEDMPNAPRLLVAPEEKWARVNVAALAADSPSAEVLESRARKELWRAAAMVLGAADSLLQPCLMCPIHSLADLDAVPVLVPCPEPYNKMHATAKRLGCRPVIRATYLKACQEGWAPAPTNDIQRAIWEQVKADKERGPTNPITIQPPGRVKSEK